MSKVIAVLTIPKADDPDEVIHWIKLSNGRVTFQWDLALGLSDFEGLDESDFSDLMAPEDIPSLVAFLQQEHVADPDDRIVGITLPSSDIDDDGWYECDHEENDGIEFWRLDNGSMQIDAGDNQVILSPDNVNTLKQFINS